MGGKLYPLHILNREKKKAWCSPWSCSLPEPGVENLMKTSTTVLFQAAPDMNNAKTPVALRLQGHGHCIRAGSVGSDGDDIPKDTEGSSAGWRPARQASPGVTGHSSPLACLAHWSHICCCIPGPPGVRLFLTTWSRGPGPLKRWRRDVPPWSSPHPTPPSGGRSV